MRVKTIILKDKLPSQKFFTQVT